jgi:hypothetical protein|tara:strand:+ start:239 stop:502 length:264 start_codon:yes stop_codon:yes gene_type:complete
MAEHKITLTISETDQKILSNDIMDIDKWIKEALSGKINSCYKRMQREWTEKLLNDDSFTDPIPSNKEDLIKLILSRSDYKNRKQRGD